MFIHIWMHWFWITAAYFEGFLPLLTISTCISHPQFAEAGLLDNDTLTPHLHNRNDSSQPPNITSPTLIPPSQPSTTFSSSSTSSPSPSLSSPLSSPHDDPTNETTLTTPPDTSASIPTIPTIPTITLNGDIPDTHNGGSLDAFQYPLKKFTKYSHPKYGKTRGKAKPSDDATAETVKIIEEKLNINISIADDGTTRSGAEADKHNDSLSDGGTSEIPPTDAPDSTTTVTAYDTSAGLVNETSDNATRTRDVNEDQKDLEILKNETLIIESKVEEGGSYTTVEPFVVKNRVAAATSAHNFEVEPSEMNAGSITGITLGILVVFSLFGAVSFVLYRRRYLNKPEVLHDKCSNLDSSGYIDETSLRENSEEMYSLDNDSFLNSLEAMTIQNYWTESVKHTKL